MLPQFLYACNLFFCMLSVERKAWFKPSELCAGITGASGTCGDVFCSRQWFGKCFFTYLILSGQLSHIGGILLCWRS